MEGVFGQRAPTGGSEGRGGGRVSEGRERGGAWGRERGVRRDEKERKDEEERKDSGGAGALSKATDDAGRTERARTERARTEGRHGRRVVRDMEGKRGGSCSEGGNINWRENSSRMMESLPPPPHACVRAAPTCV